MILFNRLAFFHNGSRLRLLLWRTCLLRHNVKTLYSLYTRFQTRTL